MKSSTSCRLVGLTSIHRATLAGGAIEVQVQVGAGLDVPLSLDRMNESSRCPGVSRMITYMVHSSVQQSRL
jgi:hypothetical protein